MTDVEQIIEQLWGTGEPRDVYAILDCARDKRIHPFLRRRALDYTSLYRGPVAPVLDQNAPYLVHLYRGAKWTRELFELAWGNSWGICMRTNESLESLRLHFRKFLRVRDERGRRLLFRYYDPRVLRVYLPTCQPHELKFVFGKVDMLFAENPTGDAWLRFTRAATPSGLGIETLRVDRAVPPAAAPSVEGGVEDVAR